MKPLNYNHTILNPDGTHAELCNMTGGSGGSGGFELTPLYTNTATNTEFKDTTLNLGDLSNYNYIIVRYVLSTNNDPEHNSTMSNLIPTSSLLGSGYQIACFVTALSGTVYTRCLGNNGNGSQLRIYNGYNGTSVSNNICIPYIIYGVK